MAKKKNPSEDELLAQRTPPPSREEIIQAHADGWYSPGSQTVSVADARRAGIPIPEWCNDATEVVIYGARIQVRPCRVPFRRACHGSQKFS